MRATAFEPVATSGGSAVLESIVAVPDSGMSRFLHQQIAGNDRPELTAARVIVAGGRASAPARSSKRFSHPWLKSSARPSARAELPLIPATLPTTSR